MRRAVLDTNVFVSALVTPKGISAKVIEQMQTGEVEAIVSPGLLAELESVLRREKFRRYFDSEAVEAFLEMLRVEATLVPDPSTPAPLRSVDPKDDFLLALASSQKSHLVSGDSDLIELSGGAPIITPGDLLAAPA
ncbi:MAG TPA: putative toxin-antitoxin system toxin component, PIN family [Solirubrobacterales bacterium]|nr:putative toxin-antitoxin system toxin component, PIN family [Solirubrobacterales bacterium]